jgi:maleylacetate reductase
VQDFEYDALPARIVFGARAARTRLAAEVDRLGANRVLVVASDRDATLVGDLLAPLADRVAGTFGAVREHVPVATAEAARAAARAARADALLCIGGGSTTGTAKAVAVTTGLPILAVPTTYAGSEVTPVWGLTEGARKTTGVDPVVVARTVVYDPELTASLPTDLAVASGLNALAHGVEAFWAPRRNPVSSVLAEDGIRALATGLRRREAADVLRGAWLTASAFAVAGAGLHHKLCHVLGGTYGLPHARTHAIVLPHVLAFNAPGSPEARERTARALGVEDAVAGLRALTAELGVPRGLRDIGFRAAHVDEAATLTEPAAPADNPVPVRGGALRGLVRAAWAGEYR